MTLLKAIEIQDYYWHHPMHSPTIDQLDALQLLIEAGKRIQRQRLLTIPVNQPPLPGETIL